MLRAAPLEPGVPPPRSQRRCRGGAPASETDPRSVRQAWRAPRSPRAGARTAGRWLCVRTRGGCKDPWHVEGNRSETVDGGQARSSPHSRKVHAPSTETDESRLSVGGATDTTCSAPTVPEMGEVGYRIRIPVPSSPGLEEPKSEATEQTASRRKTNQSRTSPNLEYPVRHLSADSPNSPKVSVLAQQRVQKPCFQSQQG